jgi:hypothetical protein
MKDIIKIDKKDHIKSLFTRTMIQQKSKIISDKNLFFKQKQLKTIKK